MNPTTLGDVAICTTCGACALGHAHDAGPCEAHLAEWVAAFWQRQTPRVALALLRAAPKVAMEWTQEEPIYGDAGEEWVRRAPDYSGSRMLLARVKVRRRIVTWSVGPALENGDAPTLAEAKAAADAALARAGWVLVD